ncbi:MAG: hypothetical protein RIG62_06980 [Cyclobacteriaceae bacterium]
MKVFFSSTLILLFSIISCTFASTQTSWSSGIIITHEHQLLKGELRYDYAHDLVMFREKKDAPLQTFTAFQISSFRYFDEQEDLMHYFKSFEFHPTTYATLPVFFEIVVSGEVSYLRKRNPYPYFENKSEHRYSFKSGPRISPHILCYDYYVYLDGQIIRSSRFNKEVMPHLEDQNIAIRSHIKENKLRTYDVRDQIQLIQYTNEQLSLNPHAHLSVNINS